MKIWKICILVISVIAITHSASGTDVANDQIVVTDADTLRQEFVEVSQELVDSTSVVTLRVVIQYANTIRSFVLPLLPSQLQTLLSQIADRVVVEYANTIGLFEIQPLPSVLNTLLGNVADRIVMQFANTNRELVLGYPSGMISDDSPPQLSGITAVMVDSHTVMVTWLSDEFADSEIMYGTQPGNYPNVQSDPLYVKDHAVMLANIVPGTTYYYKVQSTDLSGNTATSTEQSFTATVSIYLPLTLK